MSAPPLRRMPSKTGRERLAVADVDLVPLDVRVHGRARARLAAPRHADDAVVLLQGLEQVAAHEARGAGDDEPWCAHRSPTSAAPPSTTTGTARSGRSGGPATGLPAASNQPS